jgi:hypothetical protein
MARSTAFYLAKAGFKPLVLNVVRVGGAAITEGIPSRVPLFHTRTHAGSLRADVVRDMQLKQHGLELTTPGSQHCVASARWTLADSLRRS